MVKEIKKKCGLCDTIISRIWWTGEYYIYESKSDKKIQVCEFCYKRREIYGDEE